jgi:hypothetical protein
MNLKRFIDERLGDNLMPTAFHLIEVWKINAHRAGGYFNLLFFWAYPIAFFCMLPVSILFLMEAIFTPKKQ